MRKLQWYWGSVWTAALAVTLILTSPAGAQQTQQQQTQNQQTQAKPGTSATTPSKGAATPFDPCTGDGLPATQQTAPFAPGSPNDTTPPEPKSFGGKVSCSNGKCKSTVKNPYATPAKQENAFPEAQSEEAQSEATKAETAKTGAAQKAGAAVNAAVNAPAPSGAEANPFPEAQSKAAEKKAQESANEPPAQQGAYSSSNQRMSGVNALGNGPAEFSDSDGHPSNDPYLAAQDDKVGKFYQHSNDWPGAYGRYKEATEANPGDIHAVIGLAVAADHMGKRAEAIENYKLYLAAMPDGPQSKEALKALKRLGKKH